VPRPPWQTQFKNLLFRRGEPRFYAFDLLWCDGEDLRNLPLIERKLRLRSVVPHSRERLLFCDHIDGNGEGLFGLACENDLEGIVAKWKQGQYLPQQSSSWLKIRNRNYSQWVGREELFERERGGGPDFRGWDECVATCTDAAVAGLTVSPALR
jgi:ATP-dependent DNA ligase